MKLSPEAIVSRHGELGSIYADRNNEYALMRTIFDGNFRDEAASSRALLSSPLVDAKKIVYNLINAAVRRYMDEMTAPVAILGVPYGTDQRDVELAEKRAKWCWEVWQEEDITLKVVQAAFYQSNLDKAVFHVRPAPKKRFKVSIDLVVPETYYPEPSSDRWDEKKEIYISWSPTRDVINLDPAGRLSKDPRSIRGGPLMIEHWDGEDFQKLKDGTEDFFISHRFGVPPFVEVHNLPIPHRERGQGDGDQAVGLNRYLNELITDQANVLTYLAHPIIVIRGSRIGVSSLPFGPRAIWELEREGSADILTWAGSPPSFEAQIIRVMQAIEDITGISAPAFGREIPSGVSGETVRSILAGFNTRIGAKQTLMGLAIKKVFELAQLMVAKTFPSAEFVIPGEEGHSSLKPAKLKAKEMGEWQRVQVVFQPQNETVRVFSELQKVERGVQSKYTTMKRLGINNAADEMKRIQEEARLDALLAMARNGSLAGFQQGRGVAGDLTDFASAQGTPRAQPFNDANVPQIIRDMNASNPGTLRDLLGDEDAANAARTRSSRVEIREAQDALSDLDVSGKVFLEGNIVEEGTVDDRFTVRVEREEDVAQVKEALGALADRADVRVANEDQTASGPRLRVGARRRR